MTSRQKYYPITLTDDTPGEYLLSSNLNDQDIMIFSAKELCELEPEKFYIRKIKTDGITCNLFYEGDKNIVHSDKDTVEPFDGISFSCKKSILSDKSESYSIVTMLV